LKCGGTNIDQIYWSSVISRNLAEKGPGIICMDSESPIRRIWSPRGFNRAEFDFSGAEVKPVYTVIYEGLREVANEYCAWNKL